MREIKCGDYYCEYCGDCEYCFSEDECVCSNDGEHYFVHEDE